jgi:hypothetical protein
LVKLDTYRQYFSGDTYQGATVVNTTTTSKTSFTKNKGKFHEKIFLGPCGAKNPENITAKKFQSTKYNTPSFIGIAKREEKLSARRGGLHVYRVTLELLGYDACSIFNADPGGLCIPFDRPLHCRLQGDAGVMAPEAHQHVVGHCLCQSTTLLL